MPSEKVNLTLPVYNEAGQLSLSVHKLMAFLVVPPRYHWEVVIVDNGSTDATWPIAKQLEQEAREGTGSSCASVRAARETVTLSALRIDQAGRGGALRAAWSASRADILSYMDIDLSTDLKHLPELIGEIAEGKADIVIGSRLLPASRTTRGWKRELLSRGYNWLVRMALGSSLRDHQCGFKALSHRAAHALLPLVNDNGFFFDTELLIWAQRGGWRVAELPVRWVEDPDSRVHLISTIIGDLRGILRLRRRWGPS